MQHSDVGAGYTGISNKVESQVWQVCSKYDGKRWNEKNLNVYYLLNNLCCVLCFKLISVLLILWLTKINEHLFSMRLNNGIPKRTCEVKHCALKPHNFFGLRFKPNMLHTTFLFPDGYHVRLNGFVNKCHLSRLRYFLCLCRIWRKLEKEQRKISILDDITSQCQIVWGK